MTPDDEVGLGPRDLAAKRKQGCSKGGDRHARCGRAVGSIFLLQYSHCCAGPNSLGDWGRGHPCLEDGQFPSTTTFFPSWPEHRDPSKETLQRIQSRKTGKHDNAPLDLSLIVLPLQTDHYCPSNAYPNSNMVERRRPIYNRVKWESSPSHP